MIRLEDFLYGKMQGQFRTQGVRPPFLPLLVSDTRRREEGSDETLASGLAGVVLSGRDMESIGSMFPRGCYILRTLLRLNLSVSRPSFLFHLRAILTSRDNEIFIQLFSGASASAQSQQHYAQNTPSTPNSTIPSTSCRSRDKPTTNMALQKKLLNVAEYFQHEYLKVRSL